MPRVIVGVAGLYSMIMSTERRSNLQPFTGNGDGLHMSEKFWSGTKNNQTNKQPSQKQTGELLKIYSENDVSSITRVVSS